ncbi:MAG: bacteriocin family protein [Ectothiorhodospiraceae bacterium]|nr:bacteriocin family protein [Chromatiales bacterium]MCP5154492.1 bacteriocin family protein [Ectothiorhodospiraceae bacterium]
MSRLRRHQAPFGAGVWAEIDAEAVRTIKLTLAGRKLFDFAGPLGWAACAIGTGRATDAAAPVEGVRASVRRALPLVELRIPFALDRRELESIDRGAEDADLEPVVQAARTAAMAEDGIVFRGFEAGQIGGVLSGAPDPLEIDDDYTRYPELVASALEQLRRHGVEGPYAIALGPRCYTALTRTANAGYPVIQHVRKLIDGPLVWAPALDGAVVVSQRGGDFRLTVGADFSIGYASHDDARVELYIEESLTFQALTPEAAVWLRYPTTAGTSPRRRGGRS